MINPLKYRLFLRTLYTAALQANLTGRDMRALAEELRRGRLSDELAYMLERCSEHFMSSDRSDDFSNIIQEAEYIVKERKISKESLFNIIMSIDSSSLPNSINSASVKQMVSRFVESASELEVRKFLDILSSVSAPDPYLKGISEGRE